MLGHIVRSIHKDDRYCVGEMFLNKPSFSNKLVFCLFLYIYEYIYTHIFKYMHLYTDAALLKECAQYSDVIMGTIASQINRLFNRLLRRTSKKTSKLRVTGLCAGNSPVTGEFSAQMASNAKMFPFDDVIMTRCNMTYIQHSFTDK